MKREVERLIQDESSPAGSSGRGGVTSTANQSYTLREVFPNLPGVANTTATTAFRIAAMWPNSIPKAHQLIDRFEMSQATAYRFIRAMKDARGLA